MKGGLVLTCYLEKIVGVGEPQGNYSAIRHIHALGKRKGDTPFLL